MLVVCKYDALKCNLKLWNGGKKEKEIHAWHQTSVIQFKIGKNHNISEEFRESNKEGKKK